MSDVRCRSGHAATARTRRRRREDPETVSSDRRRGARRGRRSCCPRPPPPKARRRSKPKTPRTTGSRPTATIEAGGAIVFKNPSTTHPARHPLGQRPGDARAATPAVPVGTEFAQSGHELERQLPRSPPPGTYTFYCTVHGVAMSGTITVTTPARTRAADENRRRPAPRPARPPARRHARPGGRLGAGAPARRRRGGSAGGAAAALRGARLTVARHGAAVHGSLTVPAADAGGRLAGRAAGRALGARARARSASGELDAARARRGAAALLARAGGARAARAAPPRAACG